MNRKRLKRRHFSFKWDGLIHLDDGSQWRLSDPDRQHDVTWWQNGETVDIERLRGGLMLRNLERQEDVPIVAAMELRLELAAWRCAAWSRARELEKQFSLRPRGCVGTHSAHIPALPPECDPTPWPATDLPVPATCGMGITSIVICHIPLGIFAVTFWHVSLSRIKRSGGLMTGSGMAIAGLVMGYITSAICFVAGGLMVYSIDGGDEAGESGEAALAYGNFREAAAGAANGAFAYAFASSRIAAVDPGRI